MIKKTTVHTDREKIRCRISADETFISFVGEVLKYRTHNLNPTYARICIKHVNSKTVGPTDEDNITHQMIPDEYYFIYRRCSYFMRVRGSLCNKHVISCAGVMAN